MVGARARDADLARGLVAGEAWAIAETWHRFAPMVLMTAERALGSRTEAEDVVQEVFCRVFRRAKTLREPDRLRSFVYSFAVRVLKAELRRRKVRGWFPFLAGRGARGDPFPRVGFRVTRSPGEALRPAQSADPARSPGLRPPANGIDDRGRDRHDDGHLVVDGEAIDGTRLEPAVALGRGRPRAGRPRARRPLGAATMISRDPDDPRTPPASSRSRSWDATPRSRTRSRSSTRG